MAALLLPKLNKLLIGAVLKGVPPAAAARMAGVLPSTLQNWMLLGMRVQEKGLDKPGDKAKSVEFGDTFISYKDWIEHQNGCAALARAVLGTEGKQIGDLALRMWALARSKNKDAPNMMRFLWKQYAHVHGITEPSSDERAKKDRAGAGESEPKDVVQIILPDNGRLIVKST